MTKMPECYFFSKFGECMNKECPFLHIDPATKVQDCPWYDRGFCRNGPLCRNRHVRRVACKNYINGFCPSGKQCKYAHPIWWPLPGSDQDVQKQRWICHYCNERGHKIQFCLKLPLEERLRLQEQQRTQGSANASVTTPGGAATAASGGGGLVSSGGLGTLGARFAAERLKYGGLMNVNQLIGSGPRQGPQKPLDEVTCFKCGEKGHYANRCNKGYLAFLSKVSLQKSYETEPAHG
ncbi:Cleavage and polyadenylation specificity factor subunit [Fasciola gigantica]|uniref:Cleavage and polyadenylation specificity factor subunit 4 n=1 Tax=Fasciola gigantica TaxID=46835 RepID=A0A504Z458_FASGI|nr:Cleavage and polyadenylation specificity factor subunit [Fasciola gigantica]